MAVRARIVVRGRVQGVWFRGSLQEEARRRHVGGWTQNEPDGSVTAELEGERDAVDALLAWAHHGPSGARVEEVAIEWIPATGTDRGRFAIRR